MSKMRGRGVSEEKGGLGCQDETIEQVNSDWLADETRLGKEGVYNNSSCRVQPTFQLVRIVAEAVGYRECFKPLMPILILDLYFNFLENI